MADAHKNFAASHVATAPSPAASGTSLVVTAGEGALFPAVPFNAVICPAGENATAANAEIVRVTTISTDTFTIARTQESSSARTVLAGDRIYAGPTAKTLTDVEAAATATTLGLAKFPATDFTVTAGSVAIGGSAVTPTEFGYLDGVTSAIQTQLNAKGGGPAYHFQHSGRHRFDAVAGTTSGLREDGIGTLTGANGGYAVFHLDPADLPAGALLRLKTLVLVNNTAPTVNFSVGLYPVSAPAGVAATLSLTVGAATIAPLLTTAPAANSITYAASADTAHPNAGLFALQVVVSGQMAANSAVVVRARLDAKY